MITSIAKLVESALTVGLGVAALLLTVSPGAPRQTLSGDAAAPGRPTGGEVRIYITARDTPDRLSAKTAVAFEPLAQPDEAFPVIMLDASKTYQTIEGFGGALTDAAAETFAKLPREVPPEISHAPISTPRPASATRSAARTSTAAISRARATPMTRSPATSELEHFSIDHDRRDRIPLIKAALAAAGKTFKIFASPWSPPAWMKTNDDMLHGGKLKPEYPARPGPTTSSASSRPTRRRACRSGA